MTVNERSFARIVAFHARARDREFKNQRQKETCARKKKMKTKAEAKLAIKRLCKDGKPMMKAYRCPICRNWHLATRRKR